jgi:hypothetical protein
VEGGEGWHEQVEGTSHGKQKLDAGGWRWMREEMVGEDQPKPSLRQLERTNDDSESGTIGEILVLPL